MPCQVEPDPREEGAQRSWNKAYHDHHDEIEDTLEQLLDGSIDLKTAKNRLRSEKRRLADRYEELFEDINTADSVKKERARILGKYA